MGEAFGEGGIVRAFENGMRTILAALAIVVGLSSLGCGRTEPKITAADPESEGAVYVAVKTPEESDALDQYWVALAPVGSSDDAAKHVRHLGRGSSATRINHVEPGTYEVRLHGGWPRQAHNVVDRRVVEVK